MKNVESRQADGKNDRPPTPSGEARRGGFRDTCPKCWRYLATTGAAACPAHFVPVRDRPRDPGPGGGRAA